MKPEVEAAVAAVEEMLIDPTCAAFLDEQVADIRTLIAALRDAEKKLRIAEVKEAGMHTVNNLCPDHRDKQRNEPCLACTNETLARKLRGRE